MRGKRRLHKRPNAYEIECCKIWLDDERKLVKPSAIIALGVTAARSLTGKTVTISKLRGKALSLADGTRLFVTVHPSALLRIEDDDERHAAYRTFVADLKAAAAAISAGTARANIEKTQIVSDHNMITCRKDEFLRRRLTVAPTYNIYRSKIAPGGDPNASQTATSGRAYGTDSRTGETGSLQLGLHVFGRSDEREIDIHDAIEVLRSAR